MYMHKALLARLRALGRRTLGATDGILSFGDIALDTSTLILYLTLEQPPSISQNYNL